MSNMTDLRVCNGGINSYIEHITEVRRRHFSGHVQNRQFEFLFSVNVAYSPLGGQSSVRDNDFIHSRVNISNSHSVGEEFAHKSPEKSSMLCGAEFKGAGGNPEVFPEDFVFNGIESARVDYYSLEHRTGRPGLCFDESGHFGGRGELCNDGLQATAGLSGQQGVHQGGILRELLVRVYFMDSLVVEFSEVLDYECIDDDELILGDMVRRGLFHLFRRRDEESAHAEAFSSVNVYTHMSCVANNESLGKCIGENEWRELRFVSESVVIAHRALGMLFE
jgi:hypothetical protein